MPVEIVIPDKSLRLQSEIDALGPLFENYKIETPEANAQAANDLLRVKKYAAEYDAQRKEGTAPLDEEKKAWMDAYRPRLDFLGRAETTIKRAMVAYENERQRKERAAQAAADEAARKEREKLAKEAAKLEKKGKSEQAQQLREEATMVPAPLVTIEKPKVAGVHTKTRWRARVTAPLELIRGVGAQHVPAAALEIKQGWLDAQAQMHDGKLNYPGVECYEELAVAASRRG